uniref:Glycoside hydrolase family 19 catalytic domain-containing protein n=1 Tax=Acrobeloides nanus TaxID=290746 RepID=A0A914C620_9BILA
MPSSELETWFKKEMFYDLFPHANLGWGPHSCLPYSYESFIIAARYFPEFGTSSPKNGYPREENTRRDVAAFFAHAVQETGENNAGLYDGKRSNEDAADCFYRGGFFNWFEGGPISPFLPQEKPGYNPEDGDKCLFNGRYCQSGPDIDYFYHCGEGNVTEEGFYTKCYFGRGAIQISYNYNYGQFQEWLLTQNIDTDLMENPNLVMTKMDPPLAMLASLWFYMTPQPPKPAMHDIILGNWNAGPENEAANYSGPIFGPTSLIINNECNGEDLKEPGGPGESRRIKAFKWFCNYFGVPYGEEKDLTCKNMVKKLDQLGYKYSYQPDWANTWKNVSCQCAPAAYGGLIPYFDPDYYPEKFVALNRDNYRRCIQSIYENPSMYGMNNKTSACLNILNRHLGDDVNNEPENNENHNKTDDIF